MRKLLPLVSLVSLFALSLLTARAACAQQPPRNLMRADGWVAYRTGPPAGAAGEAPLTVSPGGHLYQDASVPEEFAGHYALLTAEARCESCTDERVTGRPSIDGYMMNAGTPEGGRIYAYLNGEPGMSYTKEARGGWARLSGVFRVAVGTRRVRLFLKPAARQGEADDGRVAQFRNAGVYVFPDEATARAFLGGANVAGSAATDAPVTTRPCTDLPVRTFEVGALRLGMSLEEALSVFPGSDAEGARRADRHGFAQLFIDARGHTPAPGFEAVQKYWLKFLDGRLFQVEAYFGGGYRDAGAFIGSLAGRLNLPPLERWEETGGYGRFGKYLICDGAELKFFANGSRKDYVNLIDLTAERLHAERRRESESLAQRPQAGKN